jgi:hypothetical protein
MRASYRPVTAGVAAMALLAGSVSCGDVVRQGKAPVIIVFDNMQAASGADPGTMGAFLLSDVQSLEEREVGGQTVSVPVIFNDIGQATMRLIPKDAGTGAVNLNPTPWNAVTLNRYRITYIRTDGRNTPGVDVPFPVDGALTATLSASPVIVPFEIVRHQQKLEQPLASLANFGGRVFISTIAEITFYGADQTGNDVQGKATINVSFGDYADVND